MKIDKNNIALSAKYLKNILHILGDIILKHFVVIDSANSARLRLLRLSEAAEKIQRQAAINIQTGKENDARELLFQKKKVMQALEKSKSRIELLDELSTKLNEVK
jgi:phage shock protein A